MYHIDGDRKHGTLEAETELPLPTAEAAVGQSVSLCSLTPNSGWVERRTDDTHAVDPGSRAQFFFFQLYWTIIDKKCSYLFCSVIFWYVHTLWNDYLNKLINTLPHSVVCVVRSFKIYSISKFPVYDPILLTIVIIY